MKIRSGLLVLFLTSQAQAALPQPDVWKIYVDEQYGTRVEYPSWFSIREGEPALGPGERLVTPDKRAEIEIYSLRIGPGIRLAATWLRKCDLIKRRCITSA